ncbi:hypothetical protein V757_10345 [Pelistega indica]|uniref:UPF0434 protein V757_10345 n=1 Tax=Pelistega indica TaxID=1414851 RepID=V8FX04_9BURK|nr:MULTISPECIES: Trm112 family protein [Pelistega]ETD68233.1 hypothetical protein V757_10345 [Pelistega indica]
MNPDYLKKLLCPVTKKPMVYDAEKQELISVEAKLAYPIKDGIPILLKEQARPLEQQDASQDSNVAK